jgi:acyl carrier protein phosphodiesterase
MNHLAHLRLADAAGRARIGALFGDFVKGDLAGLFPPEVAREAWLHRRVDSLTDAHPFARAAKRLFPEPLRRFAPIALDVYWDHLLLSGWSELSDEGFPTFEARSYALLLEEIALAPEPLRARLPRMVEGKFLRACATWEGVERSLLRLAAGWRHGERLAACIPHLRRPPDWVVTGFPDFYRDIAAEIARERAASRREDGA